MRSDARTSAATTPMTIHGRMRLACCVVLGDCLVGEVTETGCCGVRLNPQLEQRLAPEGSSVPQDGQDGTSDSSDLIVGGIV